MLPVVLNRRRKTVDIPAGAPAHTVSDAYTLPTDVDALSVSPRPLPGRSITVEAALPDGRRARCSAFPGGTSTGRRVPVPDAAAFARGHDAPDDDRDDNSAAEPPQPHRPAPRVVWAHLVDEMGRRRSRWCHAIAGGRRWWPRSRRRDRHPERRARGKRSGVWYWYSSCSRSPTGERRGSVRVCPSGSGRLDRDAAGQ